MLLEFLPLLAGFFCLLKFEKLHRVDSTFSILFSMCIRYNKIYNESTDFTSNQNCWLDPHFEKLSKTLKLPEVGTGPATQSWIALCFLLLGKILSKESNRCTPFYGRRSKRGYRRSNIKNGFYTKGFLP